MFRRLPNTLPKDPSFPADLEKLGYFINDNDQIRQIKKPDQKYQFVVNRNDRVNEVYKEAMNTICRRIVDERLKALHFNSVRLPLGASSSEPNVPIYVSPGIQRKKRVVVVFGERNQDPTIFSYRVIGDEGINKGSVINFVEGVRNSPHDLGLIITNPNQLHWYRGGSRAVGWTEWMGLPRESAVHEAFRLDPVKNTIPGNRDFREHVRYVFDSVFPAMLESKAKLEIIGLEWTGTAVLEYLCKNWPAWKDRINGICFGSPQHKIQDLRDQHDAPEDLIEFISKRSRAYFVSDLPMENMLEGREDYGCNRYASGEELYQENIIVRSWGSMMDWFEMIDAVHDFEEVEVIIPQGAAEGLPN